MIAPAVLDADWRAAHPLPVHGTKTDKNSRGRVLLAGGAEFVPGALRLTGEAALRAGAGKLQMATVAAAAMALGVLVPEAAMIGLPTAPNGEIEAAAADILAHAVERCDTLILGPGMSEHGRTAELVGRMLEFPREGFSVVLDAAALTCAANLQSVIRRHDGRIVMTPHHGEMAALTGNTAQTIAANPVAAAVDVSKRFHATVVLKAHETVITSPDGAVLCYNSDCVGLATGGSGDVLAGIIGGLLARGAQPPVAAGWGVWLHGAAGRAAATALGPIGFLARDLLPEIPRLLVADGHREPA